MSKAFTITIIGDEITPHDAVALARHWASKFEQEILHKDGGPEPKGFYAEEYIDRSFSIWWEAGEFQPKPEADDDEPELTQEERNARSLAGLNHVTGQPSPQPPAGAEPKPDDGDGSVEGKADTAAAA